MKSLHADHFESPRGGLGQAPGRHRRRRGAARSSAPPCPRPDLRPPKLAHEASRRAARLVRRPGPAVASERGPQGALGSTRTRGAAIWVSPQNGQIVFEGAGVWGGRPSAMLIGLRCTLLRSHSEYAKTLSAWAPALWPVLPRPRMAGFEVSTEASLPRLPAEPPFQHPHPYRGAYTFW